MPALEITSDTQSRIEDRVCSVISNWTGLPVFFWITVARSRTLPPTHTSSTRSETRSQPRSLLSIARLNKREIALPTLKLKPDPDCPDIFRLERALLADQAALVPGRLRKADKGWDRSVHGRLLDPDRAPPSARRQRRRANLAEQGGFSVIFRTITLGAPLWREAPMAANHQTRSFGCSIQRLDSIFFTRLVEDLHRERFMQELNFRLQLPIVDHRVFSVPSNEQHAYT